MALRLATLDQQSAMLLQRTACCLQQLRHHYGPTPLRQPSVSRLNLAEGGPSTSGRSSEATSSSRAAKQPAAGLIEGLFQRNRGNGPASTSGLANLRERQQVRGGQGLTHATQTGQQLQKLSAAGLAAAASNTDQLVCILVASAVQNNGLSLAATEAIAEHLASTSQATSTRQVSGFHMPDAPSEVKMESQLVFESAWRRFQERHGAVSGHTLALSAAFMHACPQDLLHSAPVLPNPVAMTSTLRSLDAGDVVALSFTHPTALP